MHEISIKVKRVCGRDRYYPENELAFTFQALTQKKMGPRLTRTFTEQNIRTLKLLCDILGMQIKIKRIED
jgi:hypothetical protein